MLTRPPLGGPVPLGDGEVLHSDVVYARLLHVLLLAWTLQGKFAAIPLGQPEGGTAGVLHRMARWDRYVATSYARPATPEVSV